MAAAKAKEVPMLTKFSRLDPGEYAFRKIPYYGTTGNSVIKMNFRGTQFNSSAFLSPVLAIRICYKVKLLLVSQTFHFKFVFVFARTINQKKK